MTAENEPEEVVRAKPDESVELNVDDLPDELEEVEIANDDAAGASRELAGSLRRITSPPWLESTKRLNKLLEGALRPQALESAQRINKLMQGTTLPKSLESAQLVEKLAHGALRPQALESTQRLRNVVAGLQPPGMSVVNSITESMQLRGDLMMPRSMLSDVIAKTTAERAAFSLASGLKVSDSVTSMVAKLVADTAGAGLASRSSASLNVNPIAEGVFARDIGRARSLATMQLAATSGITGLIAGDRMMASWRQSLLSEATARSLIGTIKLPDGNANLLREIVGINAATARVVSLYADQNKFHMLAPAVSARPTRELRGYLAGMPLAPDVDDLTLAVRASRGVAGIAAFDLLSSPGVIDRGAGELFEEEVVEPWVSGLAASRTLLLDRLGGLDGSVPDLLREAWHQVEQDGPAAVSMAAHAVVEVIDRTLRAVAPDHAVLEAHAAGRLNQDAVYDRNGTLAPTRAGRIAFALLQRRPEEAKLVSAQAKALVKNVTFVHEDLQAGKHASDGTVGLIRTYLVSVEATLTQLLYEAGD